MPLTKVCEQCSTSVNVKKSVCVCGHTFAKSHVTRQSKRIAMKRKRAVESDGFESELETAARQGKDRDIKAHKRALEDDIQHSYRNKRDRTYTAKTRANETQQQTMCRQELNRACTAKTRANETQQQAMCRQEHDRACTAKARASETRKQTMCRQELNRACTAKTRANETQQQAMCRQEHDRACTAKARVSETQQQTMCRQEHDRTYTAKKRALQSPKVMKDIATQMQIILMIGEVNIWIPLGARWSCWKSKKQTSVALSSAERALSSVAQEAVWTTDARSSYAEDQLHQQ